MIKIAGAAALVLVLVALVVFPLVTQASPQPQAMTVDEVGKNFMCLCGCNSLLPECPHPNCSYRDDENATLATLISQGKSVTDIKAYMVAKYGEQVLSAPPKRGFNLTAYVLPFVAIIGAGIGLVFLLRLWARRGKLAPEASEVEPRAEAKDEYRERLEKELNDYKEGRR